MSLPSTNNLLLEEIPKVIAGTINGQKTVFKRGKYLGKGASGRCYEVSSESGQHTFACKVISKLMIERRSAKDKLKKEVMIQSKLKHPNIVRFFANFVDQDNVYFLLDLCPNGSLSDLQRRRGVVTNPEARYFLNETVKGVQYLHSLKIIHRDLKLANLLLSAQMTVKIGDFGLSEYVNPDVQKDLSISGTPNYLAPETLMKIGRSFPTDIWAIGCILYTLLVGKTPFDASTVQATCSKITSSQYVIPENVDQNARALIIALLTPEPGQRPTAYDIPRFPFFTQGFMPPQLPRSCLTSTPHFNESASETQSVSEFEFRKVEKAKAPGYRQLGPLVEQLSPFNPNTERIVPSKTLTIDDESPANASVFWIDKWSKCSMGSGFGYKLNDGTTGVQYSHNDTMLLDPSGTYIQYIGSSGDEAFFNVNDKPAPLLEKYQVLDRLREFMKGSLAPAGVDGKFRGQAYARYPYLDAWLQTQHAILFMLTDGTVQLNFEYDGSKLIFWPTLGSVTYVVCSTRTFHTYQLDHLTKNGCSPDLYKRLSYARKFLDRIDTKTRG